MNIVRPDRYLMLYLPWFISLLLSAVPVLSYLTAWAGSFLIFYLSLSGWVKKLPADRPVSEQLMRPLFLVQIIFAGYMACTSIFYFLEVLGYADFEAPPPYFLVDLNQLELVAACQRYYCLGHAAFVTGLLVCMDYDYPRKYTSSIRDLPTFLLFFALITLAASTLFLLVPGLRQLYFQYNSLSFIAGTLALAYAIPQQKLGHTVVCTLLYVSNFSQALISGFKEPIIISVLVLGVFLYPFYKRMIVMLFTPILLFLFIVLPTYNQVYRDLAWSGELNSEAASDIALNAVFNSEIEDSSTWGFLTGRLSEIKMFTQYVATTPFPINYYGFKLIEEALTVVVPRAFWADKPSTEELVMERVYNAGIVVRGTKASAKPALVADGYLSGGMIGVFFTLLVYGMVAQLISIQAEKLFGGYLIGTALIYSGLFQIFWRGLSFEFLINSVFWSFMSMLVIFRVMRSLGIVQKAGGRC